MSSTTNARHNIESRTTFGNTVVVNFAGCAIVVVVVVVVVVDGVVPPAAANGRVATDNVSVDNDDVAVLVVGDNVAT
jgi:hypothetical protein